MAAIHHQAPWQTSLGQLGRRLGHRLGVVISASLATSQHQVAIGVARGGDDRRLALAIDTQEMVGPCCGFHGIDGCDRTAIGAVLEANRHREARGHLPVGLALGGAGANGGPADQIGDVLGNHGIEQFSGRWQSQLSQVQQQTPGQAEAGVDVIAAIEMGVIDQPLPAHGGAGLLEIDPHHHFQLLAIEGLGLGDGRGVLLGRLDVVDGAGAHDHQQT